MFNVIQKLRPLLSQIASAIKNKTSYDKPISNLDFYQILNRYCTDQIAPIMRGNGGVTLFPRELSCLTVVPKKFFINCWFSTITLPNCSRIETFAFSSCRYLLSLYLTSTNICTLFSTNAFTQTPINGYTSATGRYGSIFVPSSLADSYKNATNWIIFSPRIVGI